MDDADRLGAHLYRQRIAQERADRDAQRDDDLAAELRAIAEDQRAQAIIAKHNGRAFLAIRYNETADQLDAVADRLDGKGE